MHAPSLRNLLLALGLAVGLVACGSAEDKAEDYLASAQELVAEGDLSRATLELRNVFELMPNHVEARELMAQIMVQQNNFSGAYTHYLRLVEQLPDHVEGRTTLAEIAFTGRNWEEFLRHGEKTIELAPDAVRSRAIDLALQYRTAVVDGDDPARDALVSQADSLRADLPESPLLEQILFDHAMRNDRLGQALALLDGMIARDPDARRLYDQRLMLLRRAGDRPGMEAHLRRVVDQFPDDVDAKGTLIQYLIATGDQDGAEAFLRAISDPTDTDPTFYVTLVRFLRDVRGSDVARAALEEAIAVNPEPNRLRMLRAALDFEEGDPDKAIADLQSIIDGAEPSDVTNEVKITLARMLQATGNEVGARRFVDEVLADNSTDVAALKMRSAWMIKNDDTDGAIATLRAALDTSPEDLSAINLMAEAYARAGSHNLSRDFLALAVDASNNAPDPSLRYARVLAGDEQYLAAEEILISALRRDRRNADILVLLGEIYLASEDYSRTDQVIDRLRTIGTDRTLTVANALQARLLGSREGLEQALGYLEDLASREDASLNTQIALLRARLSSGQTDLAVSQAETLVQGDPDNVGLRFILATSHAANGAPDVAETLIRDLVEEDASLARAWVQLYRLQKLQAKDTEAQKTLEDGLQALPRNRDMLWAQASEYELGGDIEGAIAIYEGLYERNSNDVLVANNLASLLATHRTDAPSLEKAWTVARRLRDTDIPALQNTYGWITFRRGNPDEALPYLEFAAQALTRDPTVQIQLAEVYAALGRSEDAIAAYQRTLQVSDDADTSDHVARARAAITELQQQIEDAN